MMFSLNGMMLSWSCNIYLIYIQCGQCAHVLAFIFILKWSSLINVAFLNDSCIKPRRRVASVDSIQRFFTSQTLNVRRCDLIQCGSGSHSRLGQGKYDLIWLRLLSSVHGKPVVPSMGPHICPSVNRLQCYDSTDVTPPDGQICIQSEWHHLATKFAIND